MNNKQNITINRLDTLCSDVIDCSHSTPVWKDRGIRVIRNFNLNEGSLDFSKGFFVDEKTYLERTKRAVPEAEDIVISREAPMGTVAIIPHNLKCCLGQRLVLLKVNSNICSSSYLLFALMSSFVQNQFNKIGSTVSNLTIPELKETKIPLVKNHKAIGKLLESIANKIQVNKQINDNLAAMIKTIYEYWFVQFEFPDRNGKPYKSSGGKMVWNEQLKQNLPLGWDVLPLLDLAELYQPKTIDTSLLSNEMCYPVYSSGGYIGNYDEFNHEDSEVIVSCRGKCGNVYRTVPNSWITGNSMVVSPKTIGISKDYLYQTLDFMDLERYETGSVQKQLTRQNMSFIQVLVAERELLEKFNNISKPITLTQIKLQNESWKLQRLRDWLLPMLMNGQATIED